MVSIRQIALIVASAALLVSAQPTSEPASEPASEAAYEAASPTLEAREPFGTDHPMYVDVRSITDGSDPRLQKRNGQLYCGNLASADFGDGHDLVINAQNRGNDVKTIAAHGCLRTGCINTSGLYVCNDRNTPLSLKNSDIIAHCRTILTKCCIHNSLGQYDQQHQSGGQQFTDALGGGWNVIIAYANCNHPDTRKPDTYSNSHPQVNGWGCLGASMYIS